MTAETKTPVTAPEEHIDHMLELRNDMINNISDIKDFWVDYVQTHDLTDNDYSNRIIYSILDYLDSEFYLYPKEDHTVNIAGEMGVHFLVLNPDQEEEVEEDEQTEEVEVIENKEDEEEGQ